MIVATIGMGLKTMLGRCEISQGVKEKNCDRKNRFGIRVAKSLKIRADAGFE